jgi:hypothetical protein
MLHEKIGRVSVSLENCLFKKISLKMLEATLRFGCFSHLMRELNGWFEFCVSYRSISLLL